MTNNVVNVLFDCQEFDGLEKLQSAPLECVVNKHLVQEYLDLVGFIPNIKQTVTIIATTDITPENS